MQENHHIISISGVQKETTLQAHGKTMLNKTVSYTNKEKKEDKKQKWLK